MGFIDGFERKGLFRFTRFLGLVIVCGLIATFAVGAAVFTGSLIMKQNTHVQAEVVVKELRPPTDRTSTGTMTPQGEAQEPVEALPGINMPFSLQPYFSSARNRKLLLEHIEELSTSDKQDYVDNLAEIVETAKTENLDVYQAISSYFRLKDQQISRVAAKKSALVQTRLYIAGGAVSILGLIGLFSLILVLLAIERNTRVAPRQTEEEVEELGEVR